MRYENNIIEHETLTILRIGVLAGIVTLNNANACGINWQRANPIPQEIQSLQGVTYGGGKFVATAGPNLPGGFLTSLDGINWIQTLRDGSDTYSDVTWGGNQFVAVGGTFVWDQDTVLTSPNGVTWTGHNAYLDDVPLYGVVWNGSRYVAVGGGGSLQTLTIRTSSDGAYWNRTYDRGYSGTLRSVAWNGNRFVAVGIGKNYDPAPVLVSSDGVTWNLLNPVTDYPALHHVTWGGNRFVAVGDGRRYPFERKAAILTSPDGLNWTPRDSGTTNDLHSVAWNGSQFVAVGMGGTILTSSDGETWIPRNSGTTNTLKGITYGGNQLVAVGDGPIILTSQCGQPANYLLTVSKAGSGSGTVTSNPAGINCGADCSENYASGTAVTLTASPASGSTFAGWNGACSGTGSCAVTMNAAKNVAAMFNVIGQTSAQHTAGLFDPAKSAFYLKNSHAGGAADLSFRFGPAGRGWVPIAGDWNGDGTDTVGLFDPAKSAFYLKNSHAGGAADLSFRFGPAGRGWIPIAGDWDGNGTATVGLFDPAKSAFYLRNLHRGGAADLSFRFGPAGRGWKPLAGDWDGDGTDTVGLFDPAKSAFYLKNSHAGGAADLSFRFGPAGRGWIQVTGHWGGGSNGNTRWSALNTVCCSGGSLTYEVTIDGVAKRSTLGSCDADPTFEGFASTTAGAKNVTIKVLSPACGNAQSQGTASLAGNTCYRFTLHLQGSDLVNVLQTVACPSSSADAAAVTRAETTPVVTLPMDAVGPPAPGQIPGSLIEIRP